MKRYNAGLICLALLLLCGLGLRQTGGGEERPAPPPEEAAAAPTIVISPPPVQPSAEAVWLPVSTGEAGVVIYSTQSPAPDAGGAPLAAGGDYDFSQVVPETGPVEEEYFADALFIGDSRTDGFHLYSGLGQGDFAVKTGLSVFDIETEVVKADGEKLTVPQVLARKTYGKVYICLGLNELGMDDDQGYYSHYAELIDRVRAAQPEAVIYIQLLIPVNAQKCAEKGVADYVTNEQIAVYNELLRALAQEKRVFLVDPAQVIVDQSGQPPYDMVADGVHFKKEPYQRWLDYLKRHTVSKGEWE